MVKAPLHRKVAIWAIGTSYFLALSPACTSEAEINTSKPLTQKANLKKKDKREESIDSDAVVNIEKSVASGVSPVTSSEWDQATRPKSAEEIAAAEKKAEDMINAGVAAGDSQGAELKYPTLFYQGIGTYSCEGDTNPSTARVISRLSIEKLDSKLDDAKAEHPRSAVQSRINNDLQQSLDSAIYKRLSSQERDEWKAKGYDLDDSIAIFAMGVQKPNSGQVFEFSQPLPVAFWPASLSRYEGLISKGPRSWSAKVSGSKSFTATITLSHLATEGDKIRLKLLTTIPEDRNRSLYEVFPIPREALYLINTVQKHVETSRNTNWFFADNCDNRPEQIIMNYRLCRKENGGKYEDFPCQ